MSEPAHSQYTFGDSSVAEGRLRILAHTFEPSSRAFLETLIPHRPSIIADLGCGPGRTSRMLAELFPTALVIGLDSSAAFVRSAELIADERLRFREADITHPLPDGPYDLVYARYLLAHIRDYRSAVLNWGRSLSSGGIIVSEENDRIETTSAAVRRYLDLVTAMLADRGQRLDVGTDLEAETDWAPLEKRVSQLVPIHVPEASAAKMFLPNLEAFRKQPFIQQHVSAEDFETLRSEILALIAGREGDRIVTFWRRRIVWSRGST